MLTMGHPRHLLLVLLFPLLVLAQTPTAKESAAQICADLYNGVSYKAPTGTPVPVAADGIVVAISQNTKFGRYAVCDKHVVVLHQNESGKRVFTRYGELGSVGNIDGQPLTVGSKLKAGQEVGKTGARGEFYFETRPVPANLPLNTFVPNWSAVTQSDPAKINFQTLMPSYGVEPLKASSWTRYTKTDADQFLNSAHDLFEPNQSGTKYFGGSRALRLKVKVLSEPSLCATEPLDRAFAMFAIPKPTNPIKHCVNFETPSGRKFQAFIQEPVAEFLAREISLGGELELFALHIYSNSKVNGGQIGILVNEFNVLP